MDTTVTGKFNQELSDSTPLWERVAQLNRSLFDACVRNARRSGDLGDYEELIRWCSVAAWAASGQGWCGEVSSIELETELIRAAQQLPLPSAGGSQVRPSPRWLHVFTEAYATLGHSNLCRRWIQYDGTVTHDVIILAQKGGAPQNLVEAAQETGGQCVVLDAAQPFMKRAAELRNYAWANSDVVVLHTHPDEVLGVVAFGVSGGPVVLVENHADHVFWVGGSVADLILEIRLSGHLWTKQLRGLERSTILPIPLVEQKVSSREEDRRKVRETLGLPEDAVMLLTVGSASKYEAMPGLDFLSTVQEIIHACPKTYLVAVGPKDDGVWNAAKRATSGRIMPLGYQPDSTVFCRAADLYLEGFPLGSLTALLEAGQAGLMCVRAPLQSPLPFCSDSLSLDSIPQPNDLNDYIKTAIRLIDDPKLCLSGGERLKRDIEAQHCGAGWLARLQEIKAQIPASHRVQLSFTPVAASNSLRDWYLKYTYRNLLIPTRMEVATRVFVEAWKRTSSKPKIDLQLWRDLTRIEHPAENYASKGGAGFCERMKLWRLNHNLSSLGSRRRFLTQANIAVRGEKFGLAIKLVYQCLLTTPTCVGDSEWWKQFVKAHLGSRLIAKVRGLRLRNQQRLSPKKA